MVRIVRRRLVALLPVFTLLLTACWDRHEINDVAFVLGTAMDKEGDRYRVSVQMALPGQMSGNKGGGGGTTGTKTWHMVSQVAASPMQAVANGQRMTSRLINFSHRRVFIIGEEAARAGIRPLMDVAARDPQNRLTTFLVIAEGPASRVLSTDVPLEQLPSEIIREQTIMYMRRPPTMKHVANILLGEGQDLVLPGVSVATSASPGQKEDTQSIRVDKLAVFRDDKLIGFAEGEAGLGLIIATGQAKSQLVSIPAPAGEGHIGMMFHNYRSSLSPVMKGDQVKIRITVSGYGTVVENNSNFVMHRPGGIDRIEQLVNESVKSDIEAAVRWLQENRSDALGFGASIHSQRPGVWHRIENNWPDVFRDIEVEVISRLRIENLGYNRSPFTRREGA